MEIASGYRTAGHAEQPQESQSRAGEAIGVLDDPAGWWVRPGSAVLVLLLWAAFQSTAAVAPVWAQGETASTEYTVGGTVVDEEGAPLADASVLAIPRLSGHRWAEHFLRLGQARAPAKAAWTELAVVTASSDGSGLYRLDLPSPGPWILYLAKPGRVAVWHEFDAVGHSVQVRPFRLSPVEAKAVEVIDDRGDPVVGALVYVDLEPHYYDLTGSDPAPIVARTDARGIAIVQGTKAKGTAQVVLEGYGAVVDATVNFVDPVDFSPTGFAPSDFAGISAHEFADNIVLLRRTDQRLVALKVDGVPVSEAFVRFESGALPIGRSDQAGLVALDLPPHTDRSSSQLVVETVDGVHYDLALFPEQFVKPGEDHGGRDGAAEEHSLLVDALLVEADEAIAARGAALVADLATTHERRPTPNPDLSGTVVDQEGRPIAGALVWLDDPESVLVPTDERGVYSLPARGLAPEHHSPLTLRAVASGFAMGESTVLLGAVRRTASTVDVELRPLRSVRVSALDPSGAPLAGVGLSVRVRPDDDRRFAPWLLPASQLLATTDDGGVALLSPFEEGKLYSLRATFPGFETIDRVMAAFGPRSSPTREVALEFQQGTVQAGFVVSEYGTGIAGALVQVLEPSPPVRQTWFELPRTDFLVQVSADEDGRFELRDLAPGTVDLSFSAPGFAPQHAPAVEIAEVSGDLGSFTLKTGYEVEVLVVDEFGDPVEGAFVNFSGPTETQQSQVRQRLIPPTAADGSVTVGGLEAGTYQLGATVLRFGSYFRQLSIPVSSEELTQGALVVEVFRGQSLPVFVTVDGAPLSAGHVQHSEVRDFRNSGSGTENSGRRLANGRTELVDGKGILGGLSSGKFNVRVFGSPYSNMGEFLINLDDRGGSLAVTPLGDRADELHFNGEVLTLALRSDALGGSLEGTVVDAEGNLVPSGTVRLSRMASANLENGKYRFTGLARGSSAISVTAPGLPAYYEPIAVEGVVGQRLDIQLEAGWTVAGRVVDGEGLGVAGARVGISATEQDRPALNGDSGPTYTDERGRFVLGPVASGSYHFGAKKDGFAPTEAPDTQVVSGDVTGLVIELASGAELVGRVVGLEQDASPQAFSKLHVVLQGSGGRSHGDSVRVSSSGEFQFRDLPAGVYVVVLNGLEGSGWSGSRRKSVEVGPAERLEFDFEVGDGVLSGVVTRDGEPIEGARVTLHDALSTSLGHARTDQLGRFEITALDPGDLSLQVALGSAVVHQEDIAFFSDQEVLIDLQVRELSGRVVGQDGEPLAKAHVQLQPRSDLEPKGVDPRRGSQGLYETTDEDGYYSVVLPAAAAVGSRGAPRMLIYDVRAGAKGYGSVVKRWTSDSGDRLDFELTAGERIRLNWLQRPPARVTLVLFDPTGRVFYERYGPSRSGEWPWEFEDVPIGRWSFIAFSDLTQVSGQVEVVEGSGTLVVDLEWPETGSGGLVLPAATDPPLSARRLRMRIVDESGAAVLYPNGGQLSDTQPIYVKRRQVTLPLGFWSVELLDGNEIVGRAELQIYRNGQFEARWE